MSLKVFYDIISQPSRAVLILCKANSVKFTPCPIALRKEEHKTEEYMQINPFKTIPAIQDGDFKLTESFAIMQYISSKYGCAPHWNPPELVRRARVYEYIVWHHERLRQYATPYFITKGILPLQTGTPPDETVLKALWEKTTFALSSIEKYFLKDDPFIGGEGISIGDLLGVCEVMQIAGVDRDFMKDYPTLRAWVHRVREETNPHFDEAHKMYLHDNHISHRDLKPENILLVSDETETLIKVTDFGLSKFVGEISFMKTQCGTPTYLAPEIVAGGGMSRYGRAVDCWSLGVILFICLGGYPPFSDEIKGMSLNDQILRGFYSFPDKYWGKISDDAKDLIKRLLTVDPKRRLTTANALQHRWLDDADTRQRAQALMYPHTVNNNMPPPSLPVTNKKRPRDGNCEKVEHDLTTKSSRSSSYESDDTRPA